MYRLLEKQCISILKKTEFRPHKPSSLELKLEADLIFRYNPKDGMYHSGNIRII